MNGKHKGWHIALAFLISINLHAQQTNSFSGAVQSIDGKPLPAASVMLVSMADSSIKKYSTTDETGKFIMTGLAEARYRLSIQLIGYQSLADTLNIERGSTQYPLVTLHAVSTELGNVTVVSQKPFVEQKIDRTVINVQAMPAATGSNVLELLERIPGITVDQNGTITFKGKTGIVVLIDDKPTYLSGDALDT
jgi:hypothetical protein